MGVTTSLFTVIHHQLLVDSRDLQSSTLTEEVEEVRPRLPCDQDLVLPDPLSDVVATLMIVEVPEILTERIASALKKEEGTVVTMTMVVVDKEVFIYSSFVFRF